MNGPSHPYHPPYHPHHRPPPPPPPKRGLSPALIALLAIGGVFALGGGTCVVLGGLVLLNASADESAEAEGDLQEPSGETAAPATTPLVEIGRDNPPPPAAVTPTPGKPSTPSAQPPATGTTGGTWQCTASSSVRVCGFANACNYQMVFGNGFGKDRYLASTQAKSACEGMARAKGSSTVCVVQCTLR